MPDKYQRLCGSPPKFANVCENSGRIQPPSIDALQEFKVQAGVYPRRLVRVHPFKWNQNGFTPGGPVRLPKVDRPDATGVSQSLADPTTAKWFNTAAFTLRPLYSFGNAGRNSVIGPPGFCRDFSRTRAFACQKKRATRRNFAGRRSTS